MCINVAVHSLGCSSKFPTKFDAVFCEAFERCNPIPSRRGNHASFGLVRRIGIVGKLQAQHNLGSTKSLALCVIVLVMDMPTHGLLPKGNQDPTLGIFPAHPSFDCTLRKKHAGSFQCMCRCLTQYQHSQWLGWIDFLISNSVSRFGGTREREVS